MSVKVVFFFGLLDFKVGGSNPPSPSHPLGKNYGSAPARLVCFMVIGSLLHSDCKFTNIHKCQKFKKNCQIIIQCILSFCGCCLKGPPGISSTVDGFIFVGTNFRGLNKNDTFVGFKIRGHSVFFHNSYKKLPFRGFWNSWIGPSTKTMKIGTPRNLSHLNDPCIRLSVRFCGDKVTKLGPILRVANTSLTYYASGDGAAVKIDDIFLNCDFDAARGIRISRKYLGVFSFFRGGGLEFPRKSKFI